MCLCLQSLSEELADDLPVPLAVEGAVDIPQECVQQRRVEKFVDVLMSPAAEEFAVDLPVPLAVEGVVEIPASIPQERVQQRDVEQATGEFMQQVVEKAKPTTSSSPTQFSELVGNDPIR